jgi:hypothetical protein
MKKHLRKDFALVTLLTLMSLFSIVSVNAETQQEHVHHMSRSVMPFDLAKTTHIFKMTESGGIQKVIVKDAADTIKLYLYSITCIWNPSNSSMGTIQTLPHFMAQTCRGLRSFKSGRPT